MGLGGDPGPQKDAVRKRVAAGDAVGEEAYLLSLASLPLASVSAMAQPNAMR